MGRKKKGGMTCIEASGRAINHPESLHHSPSRKVASRNLLRGIKLTLRYTLYIMKISFVVTELALLSLIFTSTEMLLIQSTLNELSVLIVSSSVVLPGVGRGA